jgi:hypothetical protein
MGGCAPSVEFKSIVNNTSVRKRSKHKRREDSPALRISNRPNTQNVQIGVKESH